MEPASPTPEQGPPPPAHHSDADDVVVEETLQDHVDVEGGRLRRFLHVHGRKLWWLHSLYALALGAFVVAFAQKGFVYARWLVVSLIAAWLVTLLVFRLLGSGTEQRLRTRREQVGFLVMTYVLKNVYQSLLFFLLPFYWKATTLGSPNRWFVLLLALCAFLSTMDVVFDRVLMRFRWLAASFHALALFASLNLAIPALLTGTRTLWTLLTAAGVAAAGYWTLHFPLRTLRRPGRLALMGASVALAVAAAYAGRSAIPPVPMYIAMGAVGTDELEDGRLAVHAMAAHVSRVQALFAITDVVVPGGLGDRLHHVWRWSGSELRSVSYNAPGSAPAGQVRVRSRLLPEDLPASPLGEWIVEVVTEDGQIVGRTTFEVFE